MISAWTCSHRGRVVVFVLTWLVAALFAGLHIDRGWGPPDEGLLGQSAERFVSGELPHRDFDDLYTGGLTVLHGVAFSVLGTKLIALRLVLLLAVTCWIPFLYLLCRRFLAPLSSAGVTLLAVLWSVPAYPASMPSWYNLFLATVGLWGLLKYCDSLQLRWLFFAGVCAGLSILAKVTGVYFLAAAFLAVILRAYLGMPPGGGRAKPPTQTATGRLTGPWVGIGAASFAMVCLLGLLGPRGDLGTWLLLFASPALVCLVPGLVAWQRRGALSSTLWYPLLVLGLGVGAGVAPFVALFVSHGALSELVQGVFVKPLQRLEFASLSPRAGSLAYATVLGAVVLLGSRKFSLRMGTLVGALVATGGLYLLAFGYRNEGPGGIGGSGPVYAGVVGSLAASLPIATVVYLRVLLSRHRSSSLGLEVMPVYATLTVAAFATLIGFPYSNDLYFHYVAPLVLLAAVGVLAAGDLAGDRRVLTVLMCFYLIFAFVHVSVKPTSRLAIERGGLRVPRSDSIEVERFVQIMRALSTNGYTYSTPDSPEAYFLTGLKNPTRTMYEFFDSSPDRVARVLDELDRHDVSVVAISWWVTFSGRPEPELLAELVRRYPYATRAWHFVIRWRDAR